jgi:hypothetical protein
MVDVLPSSFATVGRETIRNRSRMGRVEYFMNETPAREKTDPLGW